MTTKLIVSCGFLVAFAAGLVTGVQRRERTASVPRLPNPSSLMIPTTNPSTNPANAQRRTPPPSFFARELGLDRDQRERLAKIWEPLARQSGREWEERRWELREKRDNQIIALASAEALQQYEQILSDYYEQIGKLEEEWLAAFTTVVEQSNTVMTAEQRERYQEILNRIQSERPGRGGRGGPDGGRGWQGRGGGGPGGGRRGGGGRPDRDRDEQENRRSSDGATTRPVREN